MASKGRTSSLKYLKYAVGEIVLVVIGILIALSINNWNQNRLNREYEVTMLKELQKQLKVDYNRLKNIGPYFKNIQHSVHEVVEIKYDASYPADSLSYHMNQIQTFGLAMLFNTSVYESLKSSGLDKISNPKIRNLIADVYGNSLPSTSEWINVIVRKSLLDRGEKLADIFELVLVPGEGDRILSNFNFNNRSQIVDNPEFDVMLNSFNWPMPIAERMIYQ